MWLVSVRLRAAMTEASWSKQRRVTWFVAVWFPTMLRDTKDRQYRQSGAMGS